MIKGVYNKPYLDLSEHIDLAEFDKLHPEICRAFVLGRTDAGQGCLQLEKNDQLNVNLETYNGEISPVWLMYEKYLSLNKDDPIKIAGQGLNEDQLILYIKYVFGAYNPWQVYTVFYTKDSVRIPSRMHYIFPELTNWIDSLSIFTYIKSAYFLLIEQDGISIEHNDPSENPDILREFIHIQSPDTRPFYIKSHKDSKKIYFRSRVTYFNDQDWHGGESSKNTTYALRIDGTFTQAFRKSLKASL